jgi:predicted nucleotidyltransferase
LFGSIVKGNYKIDSDIDVFLPKVENEIEKAEIASKIYKKLGIEDPIELHVISKEEFGNWYSKFIDVYEEF